MYLNMDFYMEKMQLNEKIKWEEGENQIQAPILKQL